MMNKGTNDKQCFSVTVAPAPSPPIETSVWSTVATHTFVWDGDNIILEKVDFTNGTTRTFEYFWGADKSGTEQGAGGVGGLLAVSIDGVFYIPCYDHNGNVVRYISESGVSVAQYMYDPYGSIIEQRGELADAFSFGFSTKYHDREAGMIGYQQRFYLPSFGRWLNRDPIEEEGGENLYAFCINRMPYYIDIGGTSFCCRKGKKRQCSNTYWWTGSVTVASVTWLFGATYIMIDLESNYICETCTRYHISADAMLLTISGGIPIAITGSSVEFGNVSPDRFKGSVVYVAAGVGAMGVAEASYLRLGSATSSSVGIVGGGELGVGAAYGKYINFKVTEE
jgi:RHS repeat-associated protein